MAFSNRALGAAPAARKKAMDGDAARAVYQAGLDAMRERTARLRALRLEKEAREAIAAAKPAPRTRKKRQANDVAGTESDKPAPAKVTGAAPDGTNTAGG